MKSRQLGMYVQIGGFTLFLILGCTFLSHCLHSCLRESNRISCLLEAAKGGKFGVYGRGWEDRRKQDSRSVADDSETLPPRS